MSTQGKAIDTADPGLEARLDELAGRVLRLEARLASLEAPAGPHPAAVQESAEPGLEPAAREQVPATAVLGLLGRTFLVLAGAFLLRTFTETGALPRLAGVVLGLAYGAAWALAADRAGARGRALSAGFHACASALIAYPLLWETTTRFALLPPAAAAAILLALTALLLAVTGRQQLRGIRWAVVLASLGTGFALMAATSAILVFCALFLVLAGASLWAPERPGWRSFRWPAALAADAAIFSMTVLAAHPGSEAMARNLPAAGALGMALALVVVYLGSFVIRALVRPRSVQGFEVAQTLAVLPIGFGGALRVAEAAGRGIGPLGLAALALGLCCYGAAFAFIHRQSEGSFDFRFLAWLGVLLVLGSCPVLLPAPLLALAFTALGLLSAGLGRRFQRPSLLAHGAILLAAAALASGWLARARDAFLAPAEAARTGFSWTALLVLAALAAGHLAMSARRAPSGPWQLRLPGFVQGALCLLGLGAMGLLGAAAAAGPLGPGPLAALRTLALALMAVAAAALSRWLPDGGLGWLVYPLLAATGLKLLLEDVPQGGPLTLSLAFTFFGAALLAAPRLVKWGQAAPGPGP